MDTPTTPSFEDLPSYLAWVPRYLSEPTGSVPTVITRTLTETYEDLLFTLRILYRGRGLEDMILTRDITTVGIGSTSQTAKGPRDGVSIKEDYLELEAVPKKLFCNHPSHAFFRSRRRSNNSYSRLTGSHSSNIYGSRSDSTRAVASPKVSSDTDARNSAATRKASATAKFPFSTSLIKESSVSVPLTEDVNESPSQTLEVQRNSINFSSRPPSTLHSPTGSTISPLDSISQFHDRETDIQAVAAYHRFISQESPREGLFSYSSGVHKQLPLVPENLFVEHRTDMPIYQPLSASRRSKVESLEKKPVGKVSVLGSSAKGTKSSSFFSFTSVGPLAPSLYAARAHSNTSIPPTLSIGYIADEKKPPMPSRSGTVPGSKPSLLRKVGHTLLPTRIHYFTDLPTDVKANKATAMLGFSGGEKSEKTRGNNGLGASTFVRPL